MVADPFLAEYSIPVQIQKPGSTSQGREKMPQTGKTIVYAAGAWDMFHIGHLNILQAAKKLGDILIVGVSTDELIKKYKGHFPLMSYTDRAAIVEACRYVDLVVPQEILEKDEQLERLNVDILVVGSDWWDRKVKGHQWMIDNGKKVYYLPYTKSMSSTRLRQMLDRYYQDEIRNEEAIGTPQGGGRV